MFVDQLLTIFYRKNYFEFDRYLANNYWDCPMLDYSYLGSTDYNAAKSDCGKKLFEKEKKNFFFQKKKNE